jgi:hypothetical protein
MFFRLFSISSPFASRVGRLVSSALCIPLLGMYGKVVERIRVSSKRWARLPISGCWKLARAEQVSTGLVIEKQC